MSKSSRKSASGVKKAARIAWAVSVPAPKLRPVHAAAAFGGLVGLAIGCAYLGGAVAQATTTRIQAERIAGATAAGFTEEALSAAAGGLNASALSIARRHDPYTVAGSAQRDRQSELLTARLESLRGATASSGNIHRASVAGPAAQPFRMSGALDESRDLECLTQAVYYEARGEGRDGMRAVAQVVLNRARHGAFPSSVCGVIYQGAGRSTGCQFSFTCSGVMRQRVNQSAWRRARDVASAALSGEVFARVGNATHFHTTAVSPRWRNTLTPVGQVGSHLFYRFGGRGGSANAFAYEAQPSSEADVQLIQASMNPADTVRQAGEAVAYTVLWAQETLAPDEAASTPRGRRALEVDTSSERSETRRPASRPSAPRPVAETGVTASQPQAAS